jgi:hypothetical protein
MILWEVDYDQKTDGGTVYRQILLNAKLQTGKRGQKTELTARRPLRRRKSVLDCGGIGPWWYWTVVLLKIVIIIVVL